jgi:hypothetical protein
MTDNPKDILLSRVADGEATEADWTAFRRLAEADPALWRELAEMQRDAAELSAVVNRAIALADAVEAPAEAQIVVRFSDRLRLVGVWGGWAAAAALALAWATGELSAGAPTRGGEQANLLGAFSTPDAALQAYLDRGRQAGTVLDQIPAKVILDTRPIGGPDGRVEVIFVRQIVERAVVDNLYRFGQDELGRPAPVRLSIQPKRNPT